MQGNPFQPDVNYRGYTASPLLGTPQGLSVYMDGVRLNQPFGDVVSWDLIPRLAISSTTLMPGSNPLFGLNTLGGALSIQTKDGRSDPGTTVQATLRQLRAPGRSSSSTAARRPSGLNWYVAGNLFAEDGWRDDSPSDVRQLFGKLGWQRARTTIRRADAGLRRQLADRQRPAGAALPRARLRERLHQAGQHRQPRRRSSTSPAAAQRGATLTLSGNVYYRDIRTSTFNGDINEDSLDQAVYQPNAGRAARRSPPPGYTGFPTSGADASNTPFPYWRCIANALLSDEPAEKCNGLHQQRRDRAAQLRRVRPAHGDRIARRRVAQPAHRRRRATIGSRAGFPQSTAARLPQSRSQHHRRRTHSATA